MASNPLKLIIFNNYFDLSSLQHPKYKEIFVDLVRLEPNEYQLLLQIIDDQQDLSQFKDLLAQEMVEKIVVLTLDILTKVDDSQNKELLNKVKLKFEQAIKYLSDRNNKLEEFLELLIKFNPTVKQAEIKLLQHPIFVFDDLEEVEEAPSRKKGQLDICDLPSIDKGHDLLKIGLNAVLKVLQRVLRDKEKIKVWGAILKVDDLNTLNAKIQQAIFKYVESHKKKRIIELLRNGKKTDDTLESALSDKDFQLPLSVNSFISGKYESQYPTLKPSFVIDASLSDLRLALYSVVLLIEESKLKQNAELVAKYEDLATQVNTVITHLSSGPS